MAHKQKATVRYWIERRPYQPRPMAPEAAKREANFKELQQKKDWKQKFKKSPVRTRYCFPEHAHIHSPNACELF